MRFGGSISAEHGVGRYRREELFLRKSAGELDLMRRIKTGDEAMLWPELLPWIIDFYALLRARMDPRHAPGRLKQWLGMMRAAYPEAEALHRALRTERDPVAAGKRLEDLCSTDI